MTSAAERTIEQRILTCRFVEENDECSVSSHLAQLNGFSQFTLPFTIPSTFNVIWFPEIHYASFAMKRWAYGRLQLRDLGSFSGFVRLWFFNVTAPSRDLETSYSRKWSRQLTPPQQLGFIELKFPINLKSGGWRQSWSSAMMQVQDRTAIHI